MFPPASHRLTIALHSLSSVHLRLGRTGWYFAEQGMQVLMCSR
jgi:hypothetical protein